MLHVPHTLLPSGFCSNPTDDRERKEPWFSRKHFFRDSFLLPLFFGDRVASLGLAQPALEELFGSV